ncbi:TPA: YadA-like family protein [Mannheimia haemolytica]
MAFETVKVGDTLKVGDVIINQDGINAGNQKVTNVADGNISEVSKDAVNVGQLRQVDQKIDNVVNHVNQMNNHLRAGIAGANAIAFLQRPNEPGRNLVSFAVGGYRGESAVAIGYASNSDNNKISIKFGAGEKEPIHQCSDKLPRKQLITCLQPNRRVTVDVDGYGIVENQSH